MIDHTPAATAAQHLGRLRWQCRRGMKELDTLLLRFLDSDYPQCAEPIRATFRNVLELSDPDILGYLFGRQTPATAELTYVIDRLTSYRP